MVFAVAAQAPLPLPAASTLEPTVVRSPPIATAMSIASGSVETLAAALAAVKVWPPVGPAALVRQTEVAELAELGLVAMVRPFAACSGPGTCSIAVGIPPSQAAPPFTAGGLTTVRDRQ